MLSDSSSSRRRAIAVVLAGVAGFVDAAGFLSLDLFSAHMSGNTTRLGVYLGGGLFIRAAPSAFAIVLFVASIFAGTCAMELLTRRGHRSPSAVVLGTEMAALVVLAAAGAEVAVGGHIPQTSAGVFYPLAALAVAAMGLQTSTLQRISGQTTRTTYVSGMLTNLADELAAHLLGPSPTSAGEDRSFLEGELGMTPGRRSRGRMRLILGIWFAYVVGGILGGYLQRQLELACFAIPAATIAVVIGLDLAPSGSGGGERRHPDGADSPAPWPG